MKKESAELDFNVFVGAETGILKGVNVNQKATISKNFHNLSNLQKDFEITCMSFGDSENEILLGLRNQTVKVYDVQFRSFSQSLEAKAGSGSLVGIARYDGTIVTAAQSGVLTYWNCDNKVSLDCVETEVDNMGKLRRGAGELEEEEREKHRVKLREGKEVCRMRQNSLARHQVGLGGKEVELQVWDLTRPESGPVFRSKNVKEDKLCLRQPVWVSDLCWTSQTSVAITSRHGQTRLYDLRSGQRRPVQEVRWEEEGVANTAIARQEEHQVIVGTSAGLLALWDLRAGEGYRGMVRKYGGCVGAVREISTQSGNQYFCAVGLDRFLRVWRVGAGGRKPVNKIYLKSRLNCVAMCQHFDPERKLKEEEKDESKKEEEALDDSVEIISDKEEETDDVWDEMVVINSSNKRKKDDKLLKRKKVK